LELVPKVGASAQSAYTMALGIIGAGNFTTGTLLPAIKRVPGIDLVSVCTATGVSSNYAAKKFGFRFCTTDERELLNDPRISTVLVATPHNLHAGQVVGALRAGKNVFSEKPLCLNEDELSEITRAYNRPSIHGRPVMMVGFNRRFSPMAVQIKSFLATIHGPLAMHYRINAGYVAANHWLHDSEQGGRILGEVCHFVDLLTFLTGAVPVEVRACGLPRAGITGGDDVVASLRFADGSHGTISYLTQGDKSFSKERLEVFGAGAVAVLEDFHRLELIRHGRKKIIRSRWRQDKGHLGEWRAFANSVREGTSAPIPWEEIVAVTLATLRLRDSRDSGQSRVIDAPAFMNSAVAHHSSQ